MNANRLADEKSPYLLQHAGNPVDWYPWGKEAFEAALADDKPIFLSIGYSTCHWCHVMERESFEDEEVAGLMNETFVSIKVDREERPDIDRLYMNVCQLIGQGCGWPLTVLLTPSAEPFYAATYIPRESRFGHVGMLDLVPRIAELWAANRRGVVESAGKVTSELSRLAATSPVPGRELDRAPIERAHRVLSGSYDEANGGFGSAPKFPSPHNLVFLLRQWRHTGDNRTLAMVEHTLRSMRRGGIYDHVGYGFHRYSTDAEWRLPHFEKMLYDQAMLAMAYTEGYRATRDDEYALTVREIFTYLERDMLSPEGAFYTAEDADSEGEEGKFYVWTETELDEALGGTADLAKLVYSTRPEGNFADEATGLRTGANVLHMSQGLADLATDGGLTDRELTLRLEEVRRTLLARREQRERPLRDDKILTDWNGLIIAAYAGASAAFDDPKLTRTAERAVDFLLAKLVTADGRLLHRYRDGEAAIAGTVDDYAFLIWGLIELYQATFDTRHLHAALQLTDKLLEHFWDEDRGGFYHTADDARDLIVRTKESYDGAIPSGNSVAMMNLLRLARITGDTVLEERAAGIGRAFAQEIERTPSGHTQLLSALDFALGPSHEVVIVGDPRAEDTQQLLQALASAYVPNKVVVLRPIAGSDPRVRAGPAATEAAAAGEAASAGAAASAAAATQGAAAAEAAAAGATTEAAAAASTSTGAGSPKVAPPIEALAPYVSEFEASDGRATAYVCQGFQCELPTTEVAALLQSLNPADRWPRRTFHRERSEETRPRFLSYQ